MRFWILFLSINFGIITFTYQIALILIKLGFSLDWQVSDISGEFGVLLVSLEDFFMPLNDFMVGVTALYLFRLQAKKGPKVSRGATLGTSASVNSEKISDKEYLSSQYDYRDTSNPRYDTRGLRSKEYSKSREQSNWSDIERQQQEDEFFES